MANESLGEVLRWLRWPREGAEMVKGLGEVPKV